MARIVFRTIFLTLDLPARWLADLVDSATGNKGYLGLGSILAAYFAVFGLIDSKSTQEETRAATERSLFITLVSSGGASSFVVAMKNFGEVQGLEATRHPSVLEPWRWGETYQPNRQPLHDWAEWRLSHCGKSIKDCSEKPNRPLDLELANLTGAYLNYVDLSGADLNHAKLNNASMAYAAVSGVDLNHANLRHASLWYANLEGANLHGADLHDANLRGANLKGADLTGANLDAANLAEAITINAIFDKYTIFPNGFKPKEKQMVCYIVCP